MLSKEAKFRHSQLLSNPGRLSGSRLALKIYLLLEAITIPSRTTKTQSAKKLVIWSDS